MSFERINDSRIQILHPTQGSYKDKLKVYSSNN